VPENGPKLVPVATSFSHHSRRVLVSVDRGGADGPFGILGGRNVGPPSALIPLRPPRILSPRIPPSEHLGNAVGDHAQVLCAGKHRGGVSQDPQRASPVLSQPISDSWKYSDKISPKRPRS
jgi:hypothetical protein